MSNDRLVGLHKTVRFHLSLHRPFVLLSVVIIFLASAFAQNQSVKPKPRVIMIGVNGMEMDVIRPLILKGDLPNLSSVIKNGVHGKLRTVDAPNCRVSSLLS